jgi:hypothetical protein
MGVDPDALCKFYDEHDTTCDICHRDESETGTLHIDHCHATNALRGLLCKDCNRAIGMFRDSPETLEQAAAYLRKSPILVRSE